jgi:hypothetical protein
MKKLRPQKERNITQLLRDRYDGLRVTYKKIAEFILQNSEVATFASLDELSKKLVFPMQHLFALPANWVLKVIRIFDSRWCGSHISSLRHSPDIETHLTP